MNKKKIICVIIFSIYILVLLYLTVFRVGFYHSERQINITLFVNLISIYRNAGARKFLWLFLGNICCFVPFGFLAPMLLKRVCVSVFIRSLSDEGIEKTARSIRIPSIFITLVLGFCFSFFIESVQFIFYKGVAELDDLVLNTLGTAIGCILFKMTGSKSAETKG